MTRRNTVESDHQHSSPPVIPQYDSVDGLEDEEYQQIHERKVKSNRGSTVSTLSHVDETNLSIEKRPSRDSENEHTNRSGVPQYDDVDKLEDIGSIRTMDEESDRTTTVSTHPHVTIHQSEPFDEEKHVTVIEIASKRGSSRRISPKKELAPSIPLPEHPAQGSAPFATSAPQKSSSDRTMAFDIGAENIAPVLAHRMDMNDRDPTDSAQYLNTNFFEVFAEPGDQYHSIACVWTLSFKVFEIVRIYSYKILTLIFGLLIALLGGFFFALFAFLNIWIIRPLLILARMALSQVLIVWPMFLVYAVRPCFYSIGAVFSTARLHTSRGDQVTEVWERHVHHV